MLTHAKMYEIGDKYQVVGLKDLARRKFKVSCNVHWNDVMFVEALEHAYSTTIDEDVGLRSVVEDTICNHMELLNKSEVQNTVQEFEGLAFNLLMRNARREGWIRN